MISKDCTITIDKGNASVDEDVYLYKNDMNIQILFTIVNNKYRYTKNTAIDNIIANNKASYAQVKFKKGDIEIDFEEQETKEGAVVLLIKKELIDEDTELGDYSIQIRLFDENKTSVITLPPVENCIHIQRPLFEKAGEDTNIVDQALTDMAVVTYAEPISATNSDGTYNKKTWVAKEKITTAELNRMEEGIAYNNTQLKDIANIGTKEKLSGKFKATALEDILLEIYNKIYSYIPQITNPLSIQINGLIPEINFVADNWSSMTKENPIIAQSEIDFNGLKWQGYAELKWQGSSSIKYDKKNLTGKFYEDRTKAKKQKFNIKLDANSKEWGNENKFCFKANYIDHTHAKNIIGARLWSEIVKSRSDYNSLPQELRESPNNCAIDGFPVKVTVNGVYQGLYTWNIPKDGWMFNMDENNSNHAVLCCEYNWNNKTSACEFRATAKCDGTDWSPEFPDVLPDAIKISFNNLVNCIKDTDDATFKATIGNYLDVKSAIDYYAYCYYGGFVDSLSKNMILMTYDGIKWLCSMYDMDTWAGSYIGGELNIKYNVLCPEGYQEKYNLLWERIEKCFAKELKQRYSELRQSILTSSNVIKKFTDFMNIIGSDLYAQDLIPYPNIPNGNVDLLANITQFITQRETFVDSEIEALEEIDVTSIPVTGITIDETLTIDENGTGKINVTITPANATNKTIVWSSENEKVVSVDSNTGIVTAVSIGTTTITATTQDGNYTDTCTVTVQAEAMPTEFEISYLNKWNIDNNYPEKDNTICFYTTADSNGKYYSTGLINAMTETSFTEITNAHCNVEGFERKYVNALKNNDEEGYLTWGADNRLYVRILKSKLSSATVEGMAEYFTNNPLKVKYVVDDTEEFVTYKLADMEGWIVSETTKIYTLTTGIDLTKDIRKATVILSKDNKWDYFRGAKNTAGWVSGFNSQVQMVFDSTIMPEELTLANFKQYLQTNNVRIAYLKNKE